MVICKFLHGGVFVAAHGGYVQSTETLQLQLHIATYTVSFWQYSFLVWVIRSSACLFWFQFLRLFLVF